MIESKGEKKIDGVIERIERKVPGVKFVPEKNVSHATIRIAFDHEHPKGKTWSQVGIDAAGISFNEPTIHLSEGTGLRSGENQEDSNENGEIVHEFFHHFGMHH